MSSAILKPGGFLVVNIHNVQGEKQQSETKDTDVNAYWEIVCLYPNWCTSESMHSSVNVTI